MVRGILAQDRTYRQTREEENGMVFLTNVVSHWLLTSTPMRVRLVPEAGGTNVVIEILRSPWQSGDVFGFCDRYINAFKAAVTQASAPPTA
jgi:hypothetical protein